MATDSAAVDVLITRPSGEAAQTLCRAVDALGHRSHHLPLLELHSLGDPDAEQQELLASLSTCQHLIFISGNAVRFGMRWIASYCPVLPVGVQCYAIGDATAAQLAQHGLQALTPGQDMHSEGLLGLASLQQVAGDHVVIVKGMGGRGTLRQTLERRGAQVSELMCYRRARPNLPDGALAQALLERSIDVIMVSSGEGLVNLRELLSPEETTKFIDICLIVPSERVAQTANDAGFTRVVTADNASDAAMLRALEAWHPGHGEAS